MPSEVEKKLEKRVRKFLWAGKTNVTVNRETVYAPTEFGGRNLLDIVTRNEAITITWLKSYLSFGEDRPLWAFVADELLSKNALKDDLKIDEALRRNMYLQDWRTKIIGSKLSTDLKDMVKIGDRYNVRMEALAVSRSAQRAAIIWYHEKSYATKTLFARNQVNDCLYSNHRMETVGDAETIARKSGTARHQARKDCRCTACKDARNDVKCKMPHLCYTKARKMLMSLPAKWNPLLPQPEDYEEENTATNAADAALNAGPESVTFNTGITQPTLADTFRIFCADEKEVPTSGVPPDTRMEPEPDEDLNVVYTDGSAMDNGKDNAKAGSGIYFGIDDIRNESLKIPNELEPSNQVGEIAA
ncbi:hypothetical protein DFH06DRAFT_1002080, partial [Mycena polygramma]